jgi:hypothetical protein
MASASESRTVSGGDTLRRRIAGATGIGSKVRVQRSNVQGSTVQGSNVGSLRDLAVADEGRAAEGPKIDVEFDVPLHAEGHCDAAGGFDLDGMHLAVPDGQPEE